MLFDRKRFVREQESKKPNLQERGTEGYAQAVFRRFCRHKLALVSSAVLAVIVLAAVFAPFLTAYGPLDISSAFSAAPSAEHWLGTDQVGRDVFSRVLYAVRISLVVGLATALGSTLIGVLLGLLSGYCGGAVDMVVMRVTDMVMSFPYILLVLVAAAVFKPGLVTLICILVFVDWPGAARLVRGNVLSLRETEFVQGSRMAGMPRRHILFSEILPNTLAPVLVYATNITAASILDEAALSYLGQGIRPPTPSLGNLLTGAESLTVLTSKPWLWVPPGLMLILIVVAISFIGDALRDAMDPESAELD